MFKKLIRKIRLWNPKWLPNPFYSPSVHVQECGPIFLEGWVQGERDWRLKKSQIEDKEDKR